jgi:hypothetical protein
MILSGIPFENVCDFSGSRRRLSLHPVNRRRFDFKHAASRRLGFGHAGGEQGPAGVHMYFRTGAQGLAPVMRRARMGLPPHLLSW